MGSILITGGAGFVGANLAVALAADGHEVTALDNLHRRGSKLNLPRLERAGVAFVRADVRDRSALLELSGIDALIECSAEPSALAGVDGDAAYPVETNLMGAFHCLELARREDAHLLFLSTSRVYPYEALRALRLRETETRLELEQSQELPGASAAGIGEDFPMGGARTIYGSTKLAAELLITEYAAAFGLRATVDRCGVIAGPWQMGRVDQGVFAHWLFSHHFGEPLAYIGYGGSGKQVRDLLHVDDLIALVREQLGAPEAWAGFAGNVGGGTGVSLSLLETTAICRDLTGNEVPITAEERTRPGDVPVYVSDCSLLHARTAWRPRRSAREILADTHEWIRAHEDALRDALGFGGT